MKSPLSKLTVCAFLLLASCGPTPPRTAQTAGQLPPAAGMLAPPETIVPKGAISPSVPSIKVALLLPLSGDSIAVGNSMLDAATMALSDSYFTVPSDKIHSQIILLPKDTGSTPADTARSAQAAVDQGATFIIGPLFSQSVTSVVPLAKEHHIPMLTFSNNRAVAEEGVYTFGFLPEQQVARIAEYAYLHNLQRVAVLAPNDSYGEKIKESLTEIYTQKGGAVAPAELYAPSPANIDAAVGRMAAAYNNNTEDRRFQAIFIADGGNQMKNIIAALKKSRIDLTKVKLLGTGLWDDPELAKIPEMNGAWFSSSAPGTYQIFERHFVATYGYKPVRLASLAYDAVALVASLTMPSPALLVDATTLINPQGYVGPANGLYRLTKEGIAERKLAVLEITPNGPKIIDPALRNF